MTVAWQCRTASPSPVSPSLLLPHGGLSCQVTLNSERPPTRQNRLKVLVVRLFITRLDKPRLSLRPTPAHRHVWASVFSSLCFSPPVRALSAQTFSRSHSLIPLPLWVTSQPTYLELSVYFGSSASAKNQRKTCGTHQRKGTPRRFEGVWIQAQQACERASERASVGFSVNNCPILSHCHLN